MKWLLLVLFITDFEPEQTHFATEEACMDAAEALVQTNPSFEWVDDLDRVERGVYRLKAGPAVARERSI